MKLLRNKVDVSLFRKLYALTLPELISVDFQIPLYHFALAILKSSLTLLSGQTYLSIGILSGYLPIAELFLLKHVLS